MSTDADEQADEAASLEAIFGEDIEYDAGLSAYRVRPSGNKLTYRNSSSRPGQQLATHSTSQTEHSTQHMCA